MRLQLVLGVVGQLLRLFSLAFVPPIALAVFDRQWTSVLNFVGAVSVTLLFSLLTGRWYRPTDSFHRDEALAVVSLTWLSIGLFGAVPYALSGIGLVDALFESVSGFTTTGATILTDFSLYDRAFFLWRAMTQWFGGLGVIALFVVVLPRLGIAGRQLFFAEASGAPGEAVSPQIRKSASKLWVVYTGLTLVLVVALMLGGMSVYEAFLHGFTTIAAGGFSPHPASISGYDNASIEWILCAFMLLAGTSFTLQYRVFSGKLLGFFQDGEFLFYVGIVLVATLGAAALLAGGFPSLEALRLSLFQNVSLMSSTGFASIDYNEWDDSVRAVLIVVMLVGGCAGSAAGGPKAVRLLLVFKYVLRELRRVLHPRAILPLRYKGHPVPEEILRSVFMLVVLYMLSHFILGLLLVMLGADLVLGFSAALACVGNIGPAFGIAGPMGSFAHFPALSKLLLTFGMWIGRLEIVTVLALVHPDVLRHLRWRP